MMALITGTRRAISIANAAEADTLIARNKPPKNITAKQKIPMEYSVIEYKGYRVEVYRVGKGWRASIYSSGSITPLPNSSTNLEKSNMDEIVAEAKRTIDARLDPRLI
jgi:hypothetical protein